MVEAERLNGQAVGEGTEFRLVAEFLGRKNELTYRIVEYDPPHAVTFLGENATVVSRDRITFDSTAAGTRVTYDADLALKGLLRIADPLLALAFNRVGDRALAGLRRTLAPSQPQRRCAHYPDALSTARSTSCPAISPSSRTSSSLPSTASSSASSISGCRG